MEYVIANKGIDTESSYPYLAHVSDISFCKVSCVWRMIRHKMTMTGNGGNMLVNISLVHKFLIFVKF